MVWARPFPVARGNSRVAVRVSETFLLKNPIWTDLLEVALPLFIARMLSMANLSIDSRQIAPAGFIIA